MFEKEKKISRVNWFVNVQKKHTWLHGPKDHGDEEPINQGCEEGC